MRSRSIHGNTPRHHPQFLRDGDDARLDRTARRGECKRLTGNLYDA
jgi:hypothetical protein